MNSFSATHTAERLNALGARRDSRRLPRFIAVEGPIGVGKTTLTHKLAEVFQYPVLLEPAAENPFLSRFYREGRRHALPTQLFFLLHRAQQLSSFGGHDLLAPTLVADFLIDKDELFARLTLDENEFALYQQIQQALAITAPQPDLVIYLQAPCDVLRERIRTRAIAFEQSINADYLQTLVDAYTEFFHHYTQAPLLVVNAASIDFANNPGHFDALLQQIIEMDGMRQYFNPNPTLL